MRIIAPLGISNAGLMGGWHTWGCCAWGTVLGGAVPGGAEPGGAEPGGAEPGGALPGGATPGCAALGGAELRGALPGGSPGSSATEGAAVTGPGGARTVSTGAAGPAGSSGAGAAEGVGAETTAGGPVRGTLGTAGGSGAAGGTAGGSGAAGGAAGEGAPAGGSGAVPAVSGVVARPRPYFVPLLEQVLGSPPSTGLPPPLACPQPVQSHLQLQPTSPLPAPSPYTGPTGGLAERREPASRPASPVRAARTSGCGSRQRPPPVPGTHRMSMRLSTAPLCAPLPSPSESSLPAASALVTQLVDFAARCRLDYAASLVAKSASASVCPPSVGGECALGTDVLEDRQEEFQCLEAASPHLVSILLTPEGDADALDIPTPRSYAEAIEGPYSSQWQAAMDAEMASWKSTGTYVDAVPPPRANIISGMWIFRGSLHEEIWLRRSLGFTGTFPPGTQWSLRRPVYGLRQALREWHDTLRTTLAALGFAPSTADPSLFLRTDTSLPPFYILVYVDDLVFATADIAGLAHVKSELHKRYTCTDLGELRGYLGLQITRNRARRTITLTQSHMVQQVLHRFGFTYSSPQATPLPTRHSLSALPSDESVESSGPYPELVGCLKYLMTCTRPDLAYPLSILARYVAPGRHRPEHMAAAKRVLRYLCSTSGMGLVLGGRSPVVLTGHADASWADDQATQRSSLGYTFSLGSGSVSWRATRSSSVLGSSCEAEIYAGAMAAQELRWLTYLLTDLGEPPRSPPVLYVDNKAMLALCREQRLEHRTKHIALRYFLARELQQRGQLRLAYVASEANTADVFTKALAPSMAPAEDSDGEDADEPSKDVPARTGLYFLRAVHANPPLVLTPGPSSCSKGKQSLSPPPASNAVTPDSAPATVSVSEVGESSSAASKKRRHYAQAVLPFGTPPAKPIPPPAPLQVPKPVSRELTDAEKAEEKFLKAQQLYITQWLPKFGWLLLDKNADGLPILRCSICVEHGKDDAKFGRNGTGGRDLQLGSMRCHELSGRHEEAMKRQRTLMAEIERQKRIDDFANTDKEGARLTRLMRGVEFICNNDAPIAMFQKLIGFLAEEGVEDIPRQSYGVYITQYGFNEMASAMAKYQKTQQLQHLLASPFIGITCDESTDRARGKHLIVFATFLKNGVSVMEFLSLLTVHKCDASSLFTVLTSHLESVGVDIKRVSGIGTDGASVMTGEKNGLVSRLQEHVPHLVGCHCVAHR
ncbi:unnamed protein product [Closterium sp. NIES-54]